MNSFFKHKIAPNTPKSNHTRMADQFSPKKEPSTVQAEQQNFQKSLTSTLTVARALGFFPVRGLQGNSIQDLNFKEFSVLGVYSLFIILTLLTISGISLLPGLQALLKSATAKKTGGIVNATAGGLFYSNAAISSILLRRIAQGWSQIIHSWDKHERKNSRSSSTKFMLNTIATIVLISSIIEHMFSIIINTKNCRKNIGYNNSTFYGCLKEYSVQSHSFIFTTIPYSMPVGFFIFYLSNIATFIWNFQDLFLILVSLNIVTQFRHINRMITTVDTMTSCTSDWRIVRNTYMSCSELARSTGDLLSSLVLLSFINNLYFVCLQMLNGLAPHLQGLLENMYFFGSFAYMVTRLVCVALIIAQIPLEARRSLPYLRCIPTNAYCIEIERLSKQIATEEVAFTGMGYFTVNRNFMLGVAGAIATYEVVLLQFDTYDT